MDRRRALLDSGDKILYIYKPGFTSWQNVENVILGMSSMTTTFNSSNVVVKASNGGWAYCIELKILQNTYSKYKKLVFTASSTNTDKDALISWDNKARENAQLGGIKTTLTTSAKEYSVDISGNTGDGYIGIYPSEKNATITIYDMHFE